MGMMLVPGSQLPPPAKCASCGDTDRDCIDFGITTEFYGAVIVCIMCFRSAMLEWPSQLGVTDLSAHHALAQEYERLAREREAIPFLIEDVRRELSDIISGFGDRLSRVSIQFSDLTTDDSDARDPIDAAEVTGGQANSDAGEQITPGISGSTGNEHDDPFHRTDF